MSNKFQIASTLEGFSLHKDGGGSLRFVTQELKDTDIVVIKNFHNKFGFLLFKENEFVADDMPKGNAIFDGKTPSQRLRNVLFVRFKQLQEKGAAKDLSFEAYYAKQIESIIEQIKERLDPMLMSPDAQH